MIVSERFPSFNSSLADLNQFIFKLVEGYQAGKIKTWASLKEQVCIFFTPEQMQALESAVPGWRRMASASGGVTLIHVIGVFLGLVMLPEFQALSQEEQELVKWMVLFHDVEKEAKQGTRDYRHGFRSAVTAARQLPHLGFAVTPEYDHWITPWSELTGSAMKISESGSNLIQDNEKLPEILAGMKRMFGEGSPADLIVKGILLHMSINVLRDWSQAAPLTDAEIKKYIHNDLAPLLKVLMLADNEGWTLFDLVRQGQRMETLEAFQGIEKIISG